MTKVENMSPEERKQRREAEQHRKALLRAQRGPDWKLLPPHIRSRAGRTEKLDGRWDAPRPAVHNKQ